MNGIICFGSIIVFAGACLTLTLTHALISPFRKKKYFLGVTPLSADIASDITSNALNWPDIRRAQIFITKRVASGRDPLSNGKSECHFRGPGQSQEA